MGSNDTAGITDTQGLFFYNLSPLPPIMVPFMSHPCNSRKPIQKCDFRKDGKSCPNSWYTIKSILLAPLDLRWCKCLEKIFSTVMFAICSSNLGCCTNWSNIMILTMAYLAFLANRKIWLNLTYLAYLANLAKRNVPPRHGQWVLSELHRFGSARTHKPRFWPRFSQRATGDIWFSKHRWYLVYHLSDWWIYRQTGSSQWAPWHSALEFFWVLVPVNDLAGSCPGWYILYILYIIYALIVIFSIVIDENSGQFQENDVYCEQFGANALLHRPILCCQFSNFDR